MRIRVVFLEVTRPRSRGTSHQPLSIDLIVLHPSLAPSVSAILP